MDKSSTSSETSNLSFNSDKLIDGYRDFILTMQREQAKKAQEEAEMTDKEKENGKVKEAGSAKRKEK